MSEQLQPGTWVQHTVGDSTSVLCIVCMTKDFVFFHDHTHAKRRGDLSWLVPCAAPESS